MARPPAPQAKKPLSERLSGWMKFLLLAFLPAYLMIDLVIGAINADARRSYRAQFCVPESDPADELLRQAQMPVTVLGKFDHFLRCGTVEQLTLLGGRINANEALAQVQSRAAADFQAAASLSNARREIETLAANAEPGAGADVPSPAPPGPSPEREAPDVSRDLVEAQKSLIANVASQQAKVDALLPLVDPDLVAGDWYMVTGWDKTGEGARAQVDVTRKALQGAGLSGQADRVQILRVGDTWQTVVPFPDRATAATTLSAIEDTLPYGGYLRAKSEWCRDVIPGEDSEEIVTQSCIR